MATNGSHPIQNCSVLHWPNYDSEAAPQLANRGAVARCDPETQSARSLRFREKRVSTLGAS